MPHIFKERGFKLLSEFVKNKIIIVTKPNNSRAVVILNKHKYLEGLTSLPCETFKFQVLTNLIRKYCTQAEENLKRIPSKPQYMKCFDEDTHIFSWSALEAQNCFPTKLQLCPHLSAYN